MVTASQHISLIDSHCHLDFNEFDDDREQVIQDCLNLGVKQIIVPGVSASTWQRTLSVCRQSSCLHPALGLHPYFTEQHTNDHISELDTQLSQLKPELIAVGEIGLDFYDKTTPDSERHKQIEIFEAQLALAKKYDMPIIVHNRKAHDLCISLLQQYSLRGGIIHAFNGSIQQANKYSEMGYLLGFGGLSTHPHSSKLQGLLQQLTPSQIALETDAPDMKPYGVDTPFNSPKHLPLIAESIANTMQTSLPLQSLEVANPIFPTHSLICSTVD